MGDPKFVRRFHQAGRPGAYCRVIAEGAVHAGQPVRHAPFAGERTTVAELMALDGVRDPDPAILRRALTAPVHYKMRADFEEKLARLF
jgi:MOSC domain-containing protein YiiM